MPEKPSVKLHEAREHIQAARSSVRETFEDLLPKGFIEHRRAARRELLMALRSLLDAAIERVEGK
jgi:ribosomal protein S19E (S16A)